MKILIPLVVSFGNQGGWRVLSQLANFWTENGHHVVFLSPDDTKPYYPTTADILFYDLKGNVTHEYLSDNRKKHFLGVLKIRQSLKKAINKLDVDIVLATQSLTAGPVAKSKNKARKFYYIQAYEPDFYHDLSFKNRILKRLTVNSYKLNLFKIVNSEMYKSYREIKTDMYVPPGIDLSIFFPANKTNSEKIIIGTIGRAEKHKGTQFVIEAFRQLRKQNEGDFELHIAFGDKGQEEDGIKVLHPHGDTNLAKFYNSIDVYVCAQTIQLKAIHYPILECMACKTSIITTGYFPANDENAFIIPIEDSNAIVEAILTYKNSKKIIIDDKIKNGFKEVQQFDWRIVSEKMIDYFNGSK
ncbi:glycosyltransferase [Kaistella carnis]|uniref:glycosyltransferase n=1 Tax=Kaistella carnis TaxID=1241979 RepID=UPI0028982CD6|nr:glycosyltransferase [Kaistella carnis]